MVFGLIVTGVITLASFGSAALWWHLFSGAYPGDASMFMATTALAIVIVGEPLFALWVALALRNS